MRALSIVSSTSTHSDNGVTQMVIIMLGAPGAGKGTQSDILKQQLRLFHITSGARLRDHIKRGSELYQRDDDKRETAIKRIEVFHRDTEPIIDYFRQTGVLCEINGDQYIEKVTEDLLACLR